MGNKQSVIHDEFLSTKVLYQACIDYSLNPMQVFYLHQRYLYNLQQFSSTTTENSLNRFILYRLFEQDFNFDTYLKVYHQWMDTQSIDSRYKILKKIIQSKVQLQDIMMLLQLSQPPIEVQERVRWLNKPSDTGIVRYKGPVSFSPDMLYGIEFKVSIGEHDGKMNNQRYFKTEKNHAILVPSTEIVRTSTYFAACRIYHEISEQLKEEEDIHSSLQELFHSIPPFSSILMTPCSFPFK